VGQARQWQPADLDEIWRNVNRKINDLFGRKARSRRYRSGWRRRAVLAFGRGDPGCAGLLVWLASGFYIVDEGRRCRHRWQIHRTTQPGPRWRACPIGRRSSSTSRSEDDQDGYRNNPKNKVDKEALMLTDDENIIDIQFAVRIKSAEAYLFQVRKPDLSSPSSPRRRWAKSLAKPRWTARCTRDATGEIGGKADANARPLQHQDLRTKVTLQSVQPPTRCNGVRQAVKPAGSLSGPQRPGLNVVPRARSSAAIAEEAMAASGGRTRAVGDASRTTDPRRRYERRPHGHADRHLER
jgi:membrane protease subunit HflK